MDEKLTRLRTIYKDSGLSYSDIARRMGVTPQYVSKLVNNDDAAVTERVIYSTTHAFPNVNADWLRTGYGSPYLDLDNKASIISELLENDTPFNSLIVDIVGTYLTLSDTDKRAIDTLIDKFSKDKN